MIDPIEWEQVWRQWRSPPPELGSPERPLLVPGWVVNRFGLVPIDATLQQMGIRYWVRVDVTEWDDVRS